MGRIFRASSGRSASEVQGLGAKVKNHQKPPKTAKK